MQSRAPTARSRAAGAAHMRLEPACVLSACTRMHVHSAGLHTRLHTRWVFLSAYLHLTMRVLCSCARCLPVPLVPAPCARCPEGCARWWGGEQCSTQKRGAEPPGSSELGFSLPGLILAFGVVLEAGWCHEQSLRATTAVVWAEPHQYRGSHRVWDPRGWDLVFPSSPSWFRACTWALHSDPVGT